MFACLLLLLSSQPPKRITVTGKVEAILIGEGYALTNQDSTFRFKGNRYLVKVEEIYKNNKLASCQIWTPEGYLEYTA